VQSVGRLLLGLGVALMVGCAPPAAPSTAPAAKAPAAQLGPNAPVSASAQPGAAASEAAGYRQQVIDGARREGEVNALIQSTWTPDGIRALEEAVEREYGVRLKINFTPVGNYPVRVASLLTELEANITPSFDLYQSSNTATMTLLDHDAPEAVPWGALLPPGTPPGLVKADGRALAVYTGHIGAIYDPNVISEAEAPRSLKDLADPKWRGRFMLFTYTGSHALSTLVLGREEALAALRAAVRNGAVVDTYANNFTRFAAKEYPLVGMDSSYYATALRRGIPAKFIHLDYASNSEHHLSVPKRVAHPNAARLLAAVIAGPEGQRVSEETVGTGNYYYETSLEYRIAEEARAAGLPRITWFDPAAMDLARSPQLAELEKEIATILQGG
jgi:iron(III) transport system substrate-binding protein